MVNRVNLRFLKRRRKLTCGYAWAAARYWFSNPVCPAFEVLFHVLPDKTKMKALNSFSGK
jgi:hypothetical protein